jgi:glucose-1-phosphatase
MNQIEAVLFDLGNVLAHIDFSAFWRELGFLRPDEIAPFANGYKTLTRKYESGQILTEEYLNGLRSVFDGRFTTDRLEKAFAGIILEPVDGVVDIASRLCENYQTALVSNTNEIHHNIFRRMEVMRYLKKQFLSYKLHVMKPDRGFYLAIIKELQIDPSKMIFIDDLPENVNGAQLTGMNGIKFEGIEQLDIILKKMGVN